MHIIKYNLPFAKDARVQKNEMFIGMNISFFETPRLFFPFPP
jgi:hypothetical protein